MEPDILPAIRGGPHALSSAPFTRRWLALALGLMLAPVAPAMAQPADGPRAGAWAAFLVGYDASELPDEDGPETMAGVAVGHDWRHGQWLLGVEAEVGSSHADKTELDYAAPGDRIRVHYGRDLYAGVRVGRALTRNLTAHAKGGYINTRMTVDYVGTGTNLHSFVRPGALDGFLVGGGAQLDLGRRWFVRGEYRYANFHDGLYRHQGVFGVGLRF